MPLQYEVAFVCACAAAASWPELYGQVDAGRVRRGSAQTQCPTADHALQYRVLSRGCAVVAAARGYWRHAAGENFSAVFLLSARNLVPVSLRAGYVLLRADAGQNFGAAPRLAGDDDVPAILQAGHFTLARGRFGEVAGDVHANEGAGLHVSADEGRGFEHRAVAL